MGINAQSNMPARLMRVVVANHQPGERARLVDLCLARVGFADPIVAGSGAEALQKIRLTRPDLALLACELNDMSGFDVLRALGHGDRPATIMVAPDERHAVEALAFAAADYLTMPVSDERFSMSIERAFLSADRNRQVADGATEAVSRSGRSAFAARPGIGYGDRLVGERAKRLYFLSPADIDYLEADSNYVRIHVGTEGFMNRDSLSRLSPLLEGIGYVRISRSILLNLRRVVFAERAVSGALAFTLSSGLRVMSSAGFRLEPGAQLRVARARGVRRKGRRDPPALPIPGDNSR